MSRRSRSTISALEETTFCGRVVEIQRKAGTKIEWIKIIMKVRLY